MVEGFIEGFVQGTTEHHGVVPSQTRNFVKHGLVRDALIESIAAVLNTHVNERWRKTERTGLAGAGLEVFWDLGSGNTRYLRKV